MNKFPPEKIHTALYKGFKSLSEASDYKRNGRDAAELATIKPNPFMNYSIGLEAESLNREVTVSIVDHGGIIAFNLQINNTAKESWPLHVLSDTAANYGLKDAAQTMRFNALSINEVTNGISEIFDRIKKLGKTDFARILEGELWRDVEPDWGGVR